jgi:hypothetical protein
MLTAAIALGLVVLITTAGALLAADWHAETESRQAWAAMGRAWAAQWPVDIQPERADIETQYRAVLDSGALGESVRLLLLPRGTAAVTELSPASAAIPEPAARSLTADPTRAGGRVLSADTAESAETRDHDNSREQATRAEARSPKELIIVAGRKRVHAHRALGAHRLLAVNDRVHWPAPGEGAAKPLGLGDVGRVIVLGDRRDVNAARPADDSAATTIGSDTKSARSRAPPLKMRQSVRREVLKARRRRAPPPKSSPDDPVVVDNFGTTMRVTKAELRVFETYFSDVLDELFGLPKTAEPDRA